MPLITLSGYPCSGKTTFGEYLKNYLSEKSQYASVQLINEEYLHMTDRVSNYSNAANEKIVREALKSAVSTSLSSNNIVIVDSLNYIKGYRLVFHHHIICWLAIMIILVVNSFFSCIVLPITGMSYIASLEPWGHSVRPCGWRAILNSLCNGIRTDPLWANTKKTGIYPYPYCLI